MARNPTATRDKILDSAQALVFQHGFTATTLDLVLKKANLTKGAFFHHFASKDDLALALIQRYLDNEKVMLETLVQRAEKMATDPLQQVFVIIGLIIEAIEAKSPLSEGCLFASYAFEMAEFKEETRKLARQGFAVWRDIIGGKIAGAMKQYPPRLPIDPYDLADTMLAAFEGGVVISKMEGDPQVIARKMVEFRNYTTLLFEQSPLAQAS